MTLAEDEDLQKRGVVAVLNLDGGEENAMFLKMGVEGGASFPVRNDGNHMCVNGDNTQLKTIESMLKLTVGQFSRARMRCHYGKFVIARFRQIPSLYVCSL